MTQHQYYKRNSRILNAMEKPDSYYNPQLLSKRIINRKNGCVTF